MVITNADKDPADSNVIIFRQFISFEGFTASRDTVIHIAIDTITKIKITSLDTFDTSIIYINTCIRIVIKSVKITPFSQGLSKIALPSYQATAVENKRKKEEIPH